VNVLVVLKHLFPDLDEKERRSRRSWSGWWTRVRGTKGVRIQGVDGLMVRYAQCCQPVPAIP
jgi:GTP pyrophosphokinase